MDVKFTIDWISATFGKDALDELREMSAFGKRVGKDNDSAMHGYTASCRWESGAILMWGEHSERMGCHLVLSGKCLAALAYEGYSPIDILGWCDRLGGRTSRVDLAIDLFYSSLHHSVLGQLDRLPVKGKGRKPDLTHVVKDDGGWTVYVGARTSEKFIRIYDKAKEQKDYETDWVRIEIECKGRVAHYLGSYLSEKSVSEAYGTASTLISSMVAFKGNAWAQALSRDIVALSIPKRSGVDKRGWLLNVCAPSLARYIAENPSSNFMEAFNFAVQSQLEGMS